MEKHRPHYGLDKIKALLAKRKTRIITRQCFRNAVKLGYTDEEAIVRLVGKLTADNFYKAMTRYNDHTVWQDVYKIVDGENKLYIKLQVSTDDKQGIVIQLKEDTGEEE